MIYHFALLCSRRCGKSQQFQEQLLCEKFSSVVAVRGYCLKTKSFLQLKFKVNLQLFLGKFPGAFCPK